jgi:hypothetical protein
MLLVELGSLRNPEGKAKGDSSIAEDGHEDGRHKFTENVPSDIEHEPIDLIICQDCAGPGTDIKPAQDGKSPAIAIYSFKTIPRKMGAQIQPEIVGYCRAEDGLT